MSATTTDLSTLRREVWVQQEGCETVRLFIKSDTNIIEDLKLLVLGDSRKDYHAFYLQQHLLEYYLIPTDVSPQEPIQFKRIKDRRCKCFFCCQQIDHWFAVTLSYFHCQLYIQMMTLTMISFTKVFQRNYSKT